MTDHNVFVFGSFTEDELKSLQSSPKENDVEFMFGSLDSATLRSVGIFNNRPSEIEIAKKHQTSQLVNKRNTDEIVHTTAKASQSLVSVVHKNGNIHDSSSLSFTKGISEQERKSSELPLSFVPGSVGEPLDQSLQPYGTESVTLSSTSLGNEAPVSSFEALDLIDTKNNIFNASNGLYTTATELLPRGLVNSGNLCFLNATLQALLACSPFVRLLQELRMRNIPEIGYPTLRAFAEFISGFDMPSDLHSKKKDDILLETGKPLRPVMFESVLNNFSPDMPNSFLGRPRQEDAQEFLSFVMHQLHDELLRFEGEISIVNGGKVSLVSSVSDEDGDSWETVGPRNKTAITRTQSFIPSKLSEIFGGQLRSVVKARGNKASATIQPFLLLHLNICPEPVRTIEDALHLFSAPETLEGYRASSAGKAELVSASKSVKILELPEIIILHLMRFSYGSQGSTKLLKPVYFPLELILNHELLVSPSTEGRRYELVATITHHGREPSKGHYTADILHPSGKWLHYDDASVIAIPTTKVLHDQAYVLFYKQL
ncbi:ubiquitin carboxyl-terminal hydrolase 24-like isoform X1 [Cynara cardunculus var. scolymus]|uniref:ubiquitin carboxyl-terminal hydrolase 24-like isoform X1 n=1 Tax=Cynara cardunculus var. scolymus TaxID=59895 RepID=UPI000D623150|nr:ubiquitin carboxyl-terminal hydrolase 24-like isoform X1 [Cynara cardunculus var. scolymus]XP_024986005.1 ubiquitin carboxyl-terminal hydrolase 24-like isoform X1 [Cynara cardunculus var. scolymus]